MMSSIAMALAAGTLHAAGTDQRADQRRLVPRAEVIKPEHTEVDLRFNQDVITVKFADGLAIRLRDGVLSDLGTGSLDDAMGVLDDVGGTWSRTHSIPESKIDEYRVKAQNRLGKVIADLNLQFNLFFDAGTDIEEAIDALNSLDIVEIALPIPFPVAAPSPPDFEDSQVYLDAPTLGVDAEYMWTIPGGAGSNVSIVDLEYSWNFSHEELGSATLLGPQPNDPLNDDNHGTAVMGILGALRDGSGVTGIAHQANLYGVATNVGGGGCGDTACFPSEICTCQADCGTPPASEAGLCFDGLDNDCDGLVDCMDPDCAGAPSCAGGCGDAICVAGEICTCPADCGGPLPIETGFSIDGLDNDCDGLIDCNDPDCANDGACNGAGVWDIARSITTAMPFLNPGDVILIEQQMVGPNWPGCCATNSCQPGTDCQFGLIPVEWFLPWYNAIVMAVGNGIVVVEAAGNGWQDLDNAVYSTGNNGHWPFLPANDSGAIMVGAGAWGNQDTDRSRLWFSNYGSTLDVQGHGEFVTTTGYGDQYSNEGADTFITSTFGGTSSGSAIVAGTCASIQSAYSGLTGSVLSPAAILSAIQTTGSAQQAGTNPVSENIGPRPDAVAALCSELSALDCNNNSVADGIDISSGTSQDCNGNCYPDECDSDCDINGSPDDCDLYTNTVTYGVAGQVPGSFVSETIAQGDFDGDDDIDLVMGLPQEGGTPLLTLVNDGAGNFSQVLQYELTFWGFTHVSAADVNKDGDLDLLAIEDASQSNIRILLNDGSGTFSSGWSNTLLGSDPVQILAEHLDGDDSLDLIVLMDSQKKLSVFTGNGDGTFDFDSSDTFFSTTPHELKVIDLDGDGDRDIAVATSSTVNSPGNVEVLLNQGTGTFAAPVAYQVDAPAWSVDAADFDVDGNMDLVAHLAVAGSSTYVTVLPGNGDGTFGTPTNFNGGGNSATNLYWAPLRVTDVNLDGLPDVIANTPIGFNVSMHINDGNGGLPLSGGIVFNPINPGDGRYLVVDDLDADGDEDFVTALVVTNNLSVALNQTTSPASPDCNANAQVDSCDIAGASQDCQSDGIPDECQLAGNDCNGNGTLDECEMTDCNGNGVLDACDVVNGASIDNNGNGVPDECDSTSAPTAQSSGSRSLTVTVGGGGGVASTGGEVAIYITSPSFPCLSMYVEEDGTLGETAVFQSPEVWGGEVVVTGPDIIPSSIYTVQLDSGSPGNPALSDPAEVMTWIFGDVDENGIANFGDVLLIVQGFQGNYDNAGLEAMDLDPCLPNGVINFADILIGVQSFQGAEYVDTGCPVPCGG
jgi:hypothetical protein